MPFLGTLHKPLNLTEELASYLKSTVEKDDEVKEKETKKKQKGFSPWETVKYELNERKEDCVFG